MNDAVSFPISDELKFFRILCINQGLVDRIFGIVNRHYQECHEVMSLDEALSIVKAEDRRDAELLQEARETATDFVTLDELLEEFDPLATVKNIAAGIEAMYGEQ